VTRRDNNNEKDELSKVVEDPLGDALDDALGDALDDLDFNDELNVKGIRPSNYKVNESKSASSIAEEDTLRR